MVNTVKLKIFSVWPKIQPKTTEIIFSPYFHFKPFPPLSHTHCLSQSFTALTHIPSQTERSWSPELRRSTSITIAIDALRDRADRRQSRSSKSARLRSRSCRSRVKRLLRSRDRDRRDCDRDLADRDRTDRDCDLADRDRADRDLTETMLSFLAFICDFRNEWHYVFVW